MFRLENCSSNEKDQVFLPAASAMKTDSNSIPSFRLRDYSVHWHELFSLSRTYSPTQPWSECVTDHVRVTNGELRHVECKNIYCQI